MYDSQSLNTISYKPICNGGCYIVKVSALFGNDGNYRVSLREDCDDHTAQITDINLLRPSHRRWLEWYVKELSKHIHIQGVYFGTNGCMNCNHYPLDKFIEQHKNFSSMDYLQDIHLSP